MSTYCLSVDGAGVGTITKDQCSVPKPGEPIPFQYLVGPAATDTTAQANCAATNPNTGKQSFTKGACSNASDLTFYSFANQVAGQPPLCFMAPPAGIQGTVTTVTPNQKDSCALNLNFKYQNVTCAETGCGDHGTCTNGLCVCSDHWSGQQCEVPPSVNTGCIPLEEPVPSCGNMGSYGTCQASSSPKTGITGAGNCKCDPMTGQLGTYCEQHCTANDGSACGGPLRGVCVDNFYNYYTNPSAVKNRCACLNGWSGADCTTPPPGWKCTQDSDCTNLTTSNSTSVSTGTCDKSTGVCTCDNTLDCGSINTSGNAFTGKACQLPLSVVGASCTQDSDCPAKDQQCVGGTCSCSNTPQPSGNYYAAVVNGVIQSLVTPQGIAMIMAQQAKDKLALVLKWMTVKALEKGFLEVIEQRITKGITGQLVDATASQWLKNAVGERLAAKVLAKMTAKELVNSTASNVAEQVAKAAFEDVFGFVGGISSFANMAGMVGMVLDAFDVMGLNQESSQSQIDSLMYKMYAGVNTNKTVLANGLQFPLKQSAESTFQFQLQTLTTASRNQFATDAADYISHLTVNSNGDAIIPLFQTPVQQEQAALQAEAQGSILYPLAGKNLDVYQRLKQDWPIIVAGILVALGVLIGGAFGIKALVNKKKLALNK